MAQAVEKFMASRTEWRGTATDLLKELRSITSEDVRRLKVWPKQANGLTRSLKRAAPALRANDIEVGFSRSNGVREVTLDRIHDSSTLSTLSALPDDIDHGDDAPKAGESTSASAGSADSADVSETSLVGLDDGDEDQEAVDMDIDEKHFRTD